MELQEAMENFVFPDEIKTKLMKMYELMKKIPILTGILQKSCKRLYFIYTGKSQKGLYVLDCHSKGNALIQKISTCGPSNFYLLKIQIKVGCYG